MVGPERDGQLIAKHAVLGFRADGDAFRAGYATHDVSVRDGIAELTPYHYRATGERITGGKLGVETGAIRRSDGTVLGGAASVRPDGAGALEIARGSALEVLTNREDGIEQAWRFASAPAGSGDLTVEVQVSGQTFAGETASGLHFVSSAGLGFRYSHAVWVDSAGHEWPIQATWNGGRIAITVPSAILADSAFPATLDPTISAEVSVDNEVNGSTGQNAQFPAVAFDGTNYLIVWSDQRISRDDDLFAALVSASGAVLSTNGITVSATPGRQIHPTVAFVGGQYVVAWEDFKVTGGTEADIAAARVSTAGAVTQLGRVVTGAQNQTQPKLAANGGAALLVWNNAGDIRGSLFDGTTFGGAIAINADAAVQSDPAVAAQPGGNYLVAYTEGDATTADLFGVFVTPAGAKSGAAFPISVAEGLQIEAAAAFDGTDFVVTWSTNNRGVDLFGTRVTTAGAVLDTHAEGTNPAVGGVAISTADQSQEFSSLVCNTGGCLVIWQEGRNFDATSFDIYAQHLAVSPALAADAPEIIVTASTGPQFVPAIATDGTNFFAVWTDARDRSINTVLAARISGTGTVADPSGIAVVKGNNRESAPAMGRAGNTFGAFWTDSRNLGSDIFLMRFAGAKKLDVTPIAVSSATFAQDSPAATSSSGDFVVAWQDTRGGIDRDIFMARVNAAGTVLDPGGRAVTTAAGDQLVPAVASNGVETLIVWQDRRSGNFDILGAVVDNATGSVLAGDITICNAAGDQSRPAVAFDATSGQFLVVWEDLRIATDSNIFGARVTAAGEVLDPNGTVISGAANSQFHPRATFLNGTGLVAWEDRRADLQGDIFGARVRIGSALAVLDAAGRSISGNIAGRQNNPVVSTLVGSFLVVWADGRNVNATGMDIFGQQVGVSGANNGIAFVISNNPEDEDVPSLPDSIGEATRIAYTRFRADLQTLRVETRTIGLSAGTGQMCSNDAQCSTGFCVDDRCCDTACGGNNANDCQACAASKTGGVDGTCSFIPAVSICRDYADTFCDLREYCTGASPDCPADVGRNEGQVCNSTTGTVCPSDAAPGPHACP